MQTHEQLIREAAAAGFAPEPLVWKALNAREHRAVPILEGEGG